MRGAAWPSTSEGARRLIVVLSGTATIGGLALGRLTADPGRRRREAAFRRHRGDGALHRRPAALQLLAAQSAQLDMTESDGAFQFEDPREAA